MTSTIDENTHICMPKVEANITEYLCSCGEISRMYTRDSGELYWTKDSSKDAVEHVINILSQPGVTEITEDGS